MKKTTIFLSHITEEENLAKEVKKFFEKSFLKTIQIFVSSDRSSIKAGDKWLNNISENLESSQLMLVLCSPKSIVRPWINFESGAGWVRNTPVIPMCHSGLTVSDLPTPLNQLQSINISDSKGIESILERIAELLDCEVPEPDVLGFVTKYEEFEADYCFWDNCNEVFTILNSIDSSLIPSLSKTKVNEPFSIHLNDEGIRILADKINFLEIMDVLKLKTKLASATGPNGIFYLCHLVPVKNYSKVFKDKRFKY